MFHVLVKQLAQSHLAGGLPVDVPALGELDLDLGKDSLGCLLVGSYLAAFVPPLQVTEGYLPVGFDRHRKLLAACAGEIPAPGLGMPNSNIGSLLFSTSWTDSL